VGKTALLRQLMCGYFLKRYYATLGAMVELFPLYTATDDFVHLNVWDICGQDYWKSARCGCYPQVRICMHLYFVEDGGYVY
jgi:GTPase SAR1 family protein